jgi:hypothetical protein
MVAGRGSKAYADGAGASGAKQCLEHGLRRAARVDENQAAIVSALRDAGCKVWIIGLPVDLLIGKQGKTLLVECKTAKGKYTPLQEAFMRDWNGGPVATIRDVAGALTLARSLD